MTSVPVLAAALIATSTAGAAVTSATRGAATSTVAPSAPSSAEAPPTATTPTATTLRVGILPPTGTASARLQKVAEGAMARAINDLEGLEAVALSSLSELFGADAAAALSGCADDPCRARETMSRVPVDRLVGIDVSRGDVIELRVRLIDPRRPETPMVRVSRTTSADDFRAAVAQTVAELFTEAAARSFATLILTGGREGAQVSIDGVPQGVMGDVSSASSDDPSRMLIATGTQAVLKLKPGSYRVAVTYPGHFPFFSEVRIAPGPPTTVQVDLRKNRSIGPWLLGGSGLVLIGAAGLVGLNAQNTASDWEDACSDTGCAPGFTRQRFENEQTQVDNGRTISNVLLITGGVAIASAVLWYLFDPGVDPTSDDASLPIDDREAASW